MWGLNQQNSHATHHAARICSTDVTSLSYQEGGPKIEAEISQELKDPHEQPVHVPQHIPQASAHEQFIHTMENRLRKDKITYKDMSCRLIPPLYRPSTLPGTFSVLEISFFHQRTLYILSTTHLLHVVKLLSWRTLSFQHRQNWLSCASKTKLSAL